MTNEEAIQFVNMVANMNLDGEDRSDQGIDPFEANAEDALEALESLIKWARSIGGGR